MYSTLIEGGGAPRDPETKRTPNASTYSYNICSGKGSQLATLIELGQEFFTEYDEDTKALSCSANGLPAVGLGLFPLLDDIPRVAM
jgi:hypothetical protein